MKEIRESEWFGLEQPTVRLSPHATGGLAASFHEATALLDHFGFTPGSRPEDFWTR